MWLTLSKFPSYDCSQISGFTSYVQLVSFAQMPAAFLSSLTWKMVVSFFYSQCEFHISERSTFIYVRHEARERGDVKGERDAIEMRLMLHCFTYAQLGSIVPLCKLVGSTATRHLYRFPFKASPARRVAQQEGHPHKGATHKWLPASALFCESTF